MDTTIQKCLQTFNLKDEQINREVLRKTYFKCALQYHPDKHQETTSEKFNEIQEDYETLMKYYGYMDDEEYDIELEEEHTSFIVPSYVQNIQQYFQPFLENELIQEIKTKLLSKILAHLRNKCEDKALHLFKNIPTEKSAKIIDFMEKQDYIPRSFVDKVRDFYKEKEDNTKTIRIFPTLSDIMLDNLYKICENDVDYFVPLWHHELYFDVSDNDLIVRCEPELTQNMFIDTNNNLYYNVIKNINIK